MSIQRWHTEYQLNAALDIDPASVYHIGNSTSPMDYMGLVPGPYGTGAGIVAPAGAFATNLDVSMESNPKNYQPRSLVPHLAVAGIIVALLMVR